MVKLRKKIVSTCLATIMAVSTIGTAMAVNTADVSSNTPAETIGKYATNPNGVGKRATITIDGSHSDWSDDMLIAQGAGWDVANRYKGGHENCVLDCYALYAAWDDNNLYIGWQMVNTTDTWAREGDGPLSDGGRVLDVPLAIALSVDQSKPTMTCKNTSGGSIWGQQMGFSFETHCDMMLLMSGKVGLGEPSLFKVADAQGNTSYSEPYCLGFKKNGIEYAMEQGFMPSQLWMITGEVTTPEEEIYGGKAEYVDALTYTSSDGKKHSTTYDSFYEIKIPFAAIGISASDLESNGIGVMQIASRGESALDCIPHDPSMLDNALGEYGKDPSTTHEKDDDDVISVPFARVGGSGEIPTSPTSPTSPTEPPTTAPTDPPTTAPTDPPTTAPTDPPSTLICGDATLDKAVTLSDAIAIQKSLVTGKALTGDAYTCADVDNNARVQLIDAILVQRYTLGLLTNNIYGIGSFK